MNKVYSWEQIEFPEKLIGSYKRDTSPDRFLFYKGQPLSKEEIFCTPVITFEVKKGLIEPYDNLPTSTGSPVISSRFAELLAKAVGDDIQLFDVKLVCTDGELGGYKIVNPTHRIRGIDHERSVYTKRKVREAEYISHIKRLFFKEGCMGGHKIAREDEYSMILLVNQEIHDLVQREKITGIKLIEPDDFYRNRYR